ncbi:AAA family ATPase [Streptomyces sp. NBC_00391]
MENPEAHLHPHGQSKMAELAPSAVAQGASQLVVETHSDHVLNGIRLAVKRGLLTPEQAVVHFFRSTNGSGVEVITPHIERQQQKGGPRSDEGVHVGTMYRFKGLEYRCMIIAGVAEGLVPRSSVDVPERTDPLRHRRELQRARSLLFVAATRARDALAISWNGEPSRFLKPLRATDRKA